MNRATSPFADTTTGRPREMILDGISVWISTTWGEKLPEYEIKQVDETMVECWIPSTEGTNFEIRVDVPTTVRPGLSLICKPWLDGINYTGKVLLNTRRVRQGMHGFHIRSQPTGPFTTRLFSFGKRALTDMEDHMAAQAGVQETLNTIRLQAEWGDAGQLQARTAFLLPREHGPIDERLVKKGHTGSAGLGTTTMTTTKNHSKRRTFLAAPELKPLVFVFRYAPKDWLQAREIIPSLKRERDIILGLIAIDKLEADDDEVVIVKHIAPPPLVPATKRRKIKNEDDAKPKLEL